MDLEIARGMWSKTLALPEWEGADVLGEVWVEGRKPQPRWPALAPPPTAFLPGHLCLHGVSSMIHVSELILKFEKADGQNPWRSVN